MAKNVVSSLNLGPQIFFHGLYLYCMLDIVASYHCMQFQGKLTNQTWENGKKPSFVADFDTCGPNLGPNFFLYRFYLNYYLDIVASYHCMQCQGKLINKTWKNDKKPSFGSKIGPYNFLHGFYVYCMLGQFHIKSSNFFRTWHRYLSEFLHFCITCRYHWNMRTLKILFPKISDIAIWKFGQNTLLGPKSAILN